MRQMRSIKVRELMSRNPVTLATDTKLGEVRRLFDQYDVHAFPVVSSDAKLRGIVTKLDLLRLLQSNYRLRQHEPIAPWAEHAEDIMRRGVITVEPDDPAHVVVDLMLETRLHSLPVVERQHGEGPFVVGIVSRGDLLDALVLENEERTAAAPATS